MHKTASFDLNLMHSVRKMKNVCLLVLRLMAGSFCSLTAVETARTPHVKKILEIFGCQINIFLKNLRPAKDSAGLSTSVGVMAHKCRDYVGSVSHGLSATFWKREGWTTPNIKTGDTWYLVPS